MSDEDAIEKLKKFNREFLNNPAYKMEAFLAPDGSYGTFKFVRVDDGNENGKEENN